MIKNLKRLHLYDPVYRRCENIYFVIESISVSTVTDSAADLTLVRGDFFQLKTTGFDIT